MFKINLGFTFLLFFALFPSFLTAQAVIQTESFESTIFPAPGWRQLKTRTSVNATFSRQPVAEAANPTIAAAPGGGVNVMMLNSFSAGSTAFPDTTYMVSKPFDFSNNAGVDPSFSFYMFRDGGLLTNDDNIRVYINTAPSFTGATQLTNTAGTQVLYRRNNAFPAVAAGWHQYTYNLPAATYNQRKYYIIIVGVAMDGNNLYLDNFQTTTYPSTTIPADLSFNIFTQNGASVGAGAVDHMIVGVQCIVGGTSGCGVVNGAASTAVKLDSLLFNTNGTTTVTDIQNAKVWYTGGSNLFSTGYVSPFPATAGADDYPSARFGVTNTTVATNLDFTNPTTPANGCFYLEYDTTYFWLTYDLKSTAPNGNVVDADFRGAAVGGSGGCPSTAGTSLTVIPGPNGFNLQGSSQIDIPYCVPTYTTGTAWANYTNNDYIQSVILNGALGTVINTNIVGGMPYFSNNNAGLPTNLACYGYCDFTAQPPSYELWRPVVARTVVLNQGASYSMTAQAGTWVSSNYITAWIDYNRDGDFTDPGEQLFTPVNLLANGTSTQNFTVPAAGYTGPTRMRVREVFASSTILPCQQYTYGEVEDFPIIIAPNCSSTAYKLWLGNTDDWNNPANWCGGVPTINDSAVVSRALVPGLTTNPRPYFKPTIKSNVLANANSLFISDQDTLIINAPTPSANPLKIRTNLINNGRIESIGGLTTGIPFSKGTLSNFIITPFKAASSDARTQIIYSAAEMAAAGMVANDRITGLQFNITSKGSTTAFQNFTISYAFVPFTQHASNVPFAGPFTQVYGPVPFGTVLGLNTINLATPITWDGNSNLLIQYCFENPTTLGSSDDRISITQTTGIASTLVLSTTTNAGVGCSLAPGAGVLDNGFNFNKSNRPNFTFILEQLYNKPLISVQKNWINNGTFSSGNSRVVMDSIQAQTIGGNSPTTFHELRLNKGAANQTVTLFQPITVADTLLLDAGSLLLNGNTLSISNTGASNGTLNSPTGPITRTGGFIFSESSNLLPAISYVRWNVGGTVGWRVIPFGDTLSTTPVYIPFTFRHVTGDLGAFSVATYRTPVNNLPYPPTVGHVNIFNGGNNSANVVNRFWMTEKTGINPTTDLTFRWSDAENSVGSSGFNPPRAQPYKFIAGTPNYEAWLRISNTTPAAPAGSLLGTSVSYTQTTNILAGAADSVRVQSWNWPSLVNPNVPIGNYIPWAMSNNITPLGDLGTSIPLNVTTVSKNDIACSALPTGGIDLGVSGGVTPYTYLWNDGATTEDRSNLGAGTYTVTVTSADLQIVTTTITLVNIVTAPDGTPVISGPSQLCVIGNTPFSISGLNNVTDYTWYWNTPNAGIFSGQGTSAVISNFNPDFNNGELCVIASNGNCSGAPVCKTIDLQPISQQLYASITPPSCPGQQDGSIVLLNADSISNSRNPGLVISEIHTDPALNDSPFEWVELLVTKPIDFSVTPYTVIFSTNGTATTKGWVQGGIPSPPPNNSTYAFSIQTGVVQPGEVVYVGGSSMLPTGKRLRIKNTAIEPGDGGIGGAFLSSGVLGNGGGVADGVAVFNKPVAQLDSNTVPVDAVFFGTGVGVAALSDTSKGFMLPVNDLYAGGRLKSTSYTAPDPLGAFSLLANGIFGVMTGAFTTPRTFTTNTATWTSPVSGIGLLDNSYSWSTGAAGSGIDSLFSGTYTVTVTNPLLSQSCSTEIVVVDPQQLQMNISYPSITCFGDSVQLQVLASGGAAPYEGTGQYWIKGDTYHFSVTDSKGCVVDTTININQPQALQAQSTFTTLSCNGDTALVVITATGGTQPYTGAGTKAVTAGQYQYIVTDQNGCSTQVSVLVNEPPPLIANAVAGVILCGGDSTPVQVSATGGIAPYSGTGLFIRYAGSHDFIVTDSNGCQDTSRILITQPEPLSVTAQGGVLSCVFGGSVNVNSTTSGGSQPYSYLWSNGRTTASLSGQTLGIYTLTVTDANGCTDSDTAQIFLGSQLIQLQFTGPTSPRCPDDSSGVITSQVSSGAPPYLYQWSTGAQSSAISGVKPGNYTLMVTDALGCTISSTFNTPSFQIPLVSSIQPPATNQGLPLKISGNYLGQVDSIQFPQTYAPGFTHEGDTALNLFVPENAGSGLIVLIDSNGCRTPTPGFNYLTQFTDLTLKLYIEGVYVGAGYMNVPLVNSGLAGDAISTDSIDIYLYSVNDLTRPAEHRKTLLKTTGFTECTLPGYCAGTNYWIVIRHRNSVETWSKEPVLFQYQTHYNFSSMLQWPTVNSVSVDSVQDNQAKITGNVVSDGGGPLTARGFCWSTTTKPTIDLPTKTVNGSSTGAFSAWLSGLLPGTTYYVRAYASNGVGTAYGQEISFTTVLMDADGNTYDMVKIGTQVWMKQNLKVSKYRNGDPIPTNLGDTTWQNTTSGAYAIYNNSTANDSIYGKLYNWYAVADSRGLCPAGWHVPSDSEWTALKNFLGGSSVAGGKMKAVSSLWASPNTGATNSSGFTGLPGGARFPSGAFSYVGVVGYWWSSTQTSSSSIAWGRYLEYNYATSYLMIFHETSGFSVRCVRD